MPYNIEFPALYAITQMQADRLRAVGDNLEYYSVDVRIDYERWIQYQTEYGKWSNDAVAVCNKNVFNGRIQ